MKIKKKERERKRERAAFNKLSAAFCVCTVPCLVFFFLFCTSSIQEKTGGDERAPLSTPSDQHLSSYFLSGTVCMCLNPGAGVVTHSSIEIDIHFPYIYSGWTVVTHLSICLLSVSEIFYFLLFSLRWLILFLLFFFSFPIYDDESLFILLLYQNKYDRNMKSSCFFDSAGLRDQGFW